MSEQWFERDPYWFKRALFYEIHIRGFFDGNDDGSGDFRGLIEKLDYLQWLGIACILLLPLYHSTLPGGADDHAWFQESRSSPDSPKRNWYVWSDTDQRYLDARIIFIDTEPSNWTWDPVAGAYYWHRFFAHQPDLNYANPEVQEAMLNVLRFWLDLGIDGFRLDAVP